MKLSLPSVSALALQAALLPLSAAEQYWTVDKTQESGYVSTSGGYVDTDKQYDGVDTNLCWAASATNMITWWQRQNPGAQVAAPEAPSTQDDIWQTYRASFADTGADRYCAIDWFFEGYDDYIAGGLPALKNGNTGGYYSDLITSGYFAFADLYQETGYDMAQYGGFSGISYTIRDLLEQGAVIGLNLSPITMSGDMGIVSSGMGHALTLWGVEFDEEGKVITKMWITDSDDVQGNWRSKEVDLVELDCRTLTIRETYTEEVWDEAQQKEVTQTIEEQYETCTFTSQALNDGSRFYQYNSWAITGITYLQGSVIYMSIPEVPEPATGTLGLLALASLCMRRRRK